MNDEQFLNEFSKAHSKYESMALLILIQELRKMFKRINFNNLSFDDALNSAIIQLAVNPLELKKILYKIDYTIGIDWGTKQGKKLAQEITLEIANGSKYPFYSTQFRDKVIDYYNQYGGQNIKSISETMVKSVVEEIKAGTYQLETIEQMAERIEKTVNNPKFYKWQALRIARTETTFAMNAASEMVGEVSGLVMTKRWIARRDGRERISHGESNGQVVLQNELFTVGGQKLKFPGDGSNGATASNLVNCRCAIAYEPKRDGNGRLIFTDF